MNIRVHTKHHTSEYVRLWGLIVRSKIKRIRGNVALMFGGARPLNDKPDSPIFGYIYRFLDIDPDEPWFDIEKNEEADPEDVAQVNIPEKLKPNLTEFPYYFDPRTHRLYFQAGGTDGGVSANLIYLLFEKIAASKRVKSSFGDIDFTILTDKNALREMLSWPVIRKIYVKLERPNPSDFDDDASFYERLKRRNLKREEHTYTKDSTAESIEPDQEMKNIFKVAVDNGVYKQEGVDKAGYSREASSKSYPMEEVTKYDPNAMTHADAFISAASEIA
ncbi:DUF4747 family protein [Acidovorax sacchari]|uniref:DUF4747 family protein n=1 Tax=Acidovorax sacchari TaxID=3230736 RepID=UPI0039E4F4B3